MSPKLTVFVGLHFVVGSFSSLEEIKNSCFDDLSAGLMIFRQMLMLDIMRSAETSLLMLLHPGIYGAH